MYYVSQEYYFSCTSVISASRLDLQETSAEPPHEARGPVCRLYICGIRTINWNSINNWEKCRRSFPFSCMDENMQPHAGLPDERKEKQHEQEEEEVEKPIWWRKLNNVKDETAEGNPWEKSVTSVLWVLKKNVKVEQTFFFFRWSESLSESFKFCSSLTLENIKSGWRWTAGRWSEQMETRVIPNGL